MKLLENVRGKDTSDVTIATMMAWVSKMPVLVSTRRLPCVANVSLAVVLCMNAGNSHWEMVHSGPFYVNGSI